MSNGQVSMDTRLDLKTLEEKFKKKNPGALDAVCHWNLTNLN